MKYKKLYFPRVVLILMGIALLSSCRTYKMIAAGPNKGDFIQSPAIKLRLDNDKILRHQYYYIVFYGITSDYKQTIRNLNSCKIWSGNINYFDGNNFQTFLKKIDKNNTAGGLVTSLSDITSGAANYQSAILDAGNSTYFIQFNFSSLLSAEIKPVKNNFEILGRQLLTEIAGREGNSANIWPVSISQNILEKIWESIPVPEGASLARYVCRIDNSKSFVLINPKIKLKIDAVDHVGDGSGDWKEYRLLNSNIISITKDIKGDVIQNPFHAFHIKTLPGNITTNPGKTVLQASSEDIQLSNTLKTCRYIFLWQTNFKRNNICCGDLPDPCADSENDYIACNSHLVHYTGINAATFDSNGDLDKTRADYLSSFGYRNLMVPVIEIYLKGNIVTVPLNTTVDQLTLQTSIPANATIYRYWKRKYKKYKTSNPGDIILLPGDQINF